MELCSPEESSFVCVRFSYQSTDDVIPREIDKIVYVALSLFLCFDSRMIGKSQSCYYKNFITLFPFQILFLFYVLNVTHVHFSSPSPFQF